MAPALRTKPLSICIARCAELIHDLSDIPQFQGLRLQVNSLLSSLLAMTRTLFPSNLSAFQSDPANSPGLSLLAAYLNELGKTCGYYGVGARRGWYLSDQERGFLLGELDNPFNNIADALSSLAQALLDALVYCEHTDHQAKIDKLCEWAESTFGYWDSFQGEFEAARALAGVSFVASDSHRNSPSPTRTDDSVDFFSAKTSLELEPQPARASAWDMIGQELAQEGIEDGAIEKVVSDLKACVRSLVGGERPRFETDERQLAEIAPKNSNKPASSEPKPCSGAFSKTTTEKSKAPASSKPVAAIATQLDWFNGELVSSRVTAAIKQANGNFYLCFPEILAIASKQENDKDSRNLYQVLDLMYTMACRDTRCSRLHARLVRDLRKDIPDQILRTMATNRDGATGSGVEPVSEYLFQKCSEDWDRGKHGSNKISVENFALGLSRFIGELTKYGVFNGGHVHSLIRVQLGSTMKRNQFMAISKLLKTAGPMLDSKSDDSDMEDHFNRISKLRDKKKTPEIVKEMAQELTSLRNSGWNQTKQTKVMDRVEKTIREAM